VDAETAATMPLETAWRASSGQVQRASGVPLAVGSSQARALTSATPSRPCSQYRRRHLRAVSWQIPSRPAIAEFAVPSAASSTIRTRMTIWYGAVPRRETDSSSARLASLRDMA